MYNKMDTLLTKINKTRKTWKQGQRIDTTYVPSLHDKIKFNINYYLGEVSQYFGFKNALILDSDDLGTSVVLKAYNFKEQNIHIANYYRKKSEYEVMKKRMKDISVFPISVDNYINAYIQSNDTESFDELLMKAFEKTKFEGNRPKVQKPLPPRPKSFDFVYLDYCGEYKTSKPSVQKLFQNGVFAKEYVFAVTGSLYAKKNNTLEKYLNGIVEDIVKMSNGKARVDQIFIYNRKSQEGTATQTIQHDDVTLGEFYKETPHSIKMFFISFICSNKIENFDKKFEMCKDGVCKLQISNKQCLYHQKKDNITKKPFCNNSISDFYLMTDPMAKNQDNARILLNSFDLPYKDRNPQLLLSYNVQTRNWQSGILRLFKKKSAKSPRQEILDIDEIIELSKKDDVPLIGSLHKIRYKNNDYKVSIEFVSNNCVGIHFVSNLDLLTVFNPNKSCFILDKDVFTSMVQKDDVVDLIDKISTLDIETAKEISKLQEDNIDDLIEGLDSLDITPEFKEDDIITNGERTGIVLTKIDKKYVVVFENYKETLKLNSTWKKTDRKSDLLIDNFIQEYVETLQPEFIAVKYRMTDKTYRVFTGIVISRKVLKHTLLVDVFWGSSDEKAVETIKLYVSEEDDVWSIVDANDALLEDYKSYSGSLKRKKLQLSALTSEEIINYIRKNDRRIKTYGKTIDELKSIYIKIQKRKTEVDDIDNMFKNMNIEKNNTKIILNVPSLDDMIVAISRQGDYTTAQLKTKSKREIWEIYKKIVTEISGTKKIVLKF